MTHVSLKYDSQRNEAWIMYITYILANKSEKIWKAVFIINAVWKMNIFSAN